jgi:membrane protein involved in colicin uptake
MADEKIQWDEPKKEENISWEKKKWYEPKKTISKALTDIVSQPEKELGTYAAGLKGKPNAIGLTPEQIQGVGAGVTDIMGMPARYGLGALKLPANVLSWTGVTQPKMSIEEADKALKEITGPASTAASFAGDIKGATAMLKPIGALSGPLGTAFPAAKPLIQGIEKSPLAQTTLGGGVIGAAGSSGSPYDISKEALIGMGLGAGAHALFQGLGAVASPALVRLKQLTDAGLDKAAILKDATLGQILGGKMQKFENILNSLDIFGGVGSKVKKGADTLEDLAKKKADVIRANQDNLATGLKQKQEDVKNLAKRELENKQLSKEEQLKLEIDAKKAAVEDPTNVVKGLKKSEEDLATKSKREWQEKHDNLKQTLTKSTEKRHADLDKANENFHIKVLDDVLEPLGITVPKDKTGHDAIKFAQDEVSAAYKKHIDELGNIPADANILTNINNIVRNSGSKIEGRLAEAEVADVTKMVNERLIKPFEQGDAITGDSWHQIYKELGSEANNLYNKGDYAKARVLREIQSEWASLAEKVDTTDTLKGLNQVYSALQPVERAAANAGKTNGIFNPDQLINASKVESGIDRFAAGEAKLQKEAQTAKAAQDAERLKLEKEHEAHLKLLEDAKLAEKQALEDKLVQTNRNVESQADYYKNASAAERARIDAEQKLEAQRLAKEKLAEDRALADRELLNKRNTERQVDYQKTLGEQEIAATNKLVGDVIGDQASSYGLHRIGSGIMGLGGLGTAGHVAGNLMGVTPEVQALVGAGSLLGARGLYSDAAQKLLKDLAVKDRPAFLRAIGEGMKENAQPFGLSAVRGYQDIRQNNPANQYQYPEEEPSGGLNSIPQ